MSLILLCTQWSGDFDKGQTAYEKGDYKTALRIWTPLAEQGYAWAQTYLGLMYARGRGRNKNSQIILTPIGRERVSTPDNNRLNHQQLTTEECVSTFCKTIVISGY